MNPDPVIEVLADRVHVLFQDQKQDLDLDRVQKDLEVHLRVVRPDQNQNQDQDQDYDQSLGQDHIIEVIREIVIGEDIILSQNLCLNLDPEQNLSQDPDQDPEVSLDANDLVASKLRYQHCQDIMVVVESHQVQN